MSTRTVKLNPKAANKSNKFAIVSTRGAVETAIDMSKENKVDSWEHIVNKTRHGIRKWAPSPREADECTKG